MHPTETIDIKGHNNEPVPHTFFKQETVTDHLAIILPGRGYTSQMPLLFYPINLMLLKGADVLRVEYAYDQQPDFLSLGFDEQLRWLFADVTAAYRAGVARRAYQQITLIGKSLGTLAMGHLTTTEVLPPRVQAIWLTPLVRFDNLRQQIKQFGGPSLFVIGTADSHYDSALLAEVQQATGGGEVVAIEGADHGLNIKNEVLQSIQALEKVVQAIETFLS
jgi:pimeloyl-ACP methyl ester carboxylesterase